MVHILPCNAAERHRSCDTYPCISPVRLFVFLGSGALWSVGLAGGLVVAVRVEGEFAEDLSGGGVMTRI